MVEIIWSPRAASDIEEICDYIANDSEHYARIFAQKIIAIVEKLTEFPPDDYLSNNHDAFFYSYMLHDMVNQNVNKMHPTEEHKESPKYNDIKNFYFKSVGKSFWGPPIWFSIHSISCTLRLEDADAYKTFLWSLTRLLPCVDICRKNLRDKLTKFPPDAYLTNNHDAFFYSYMLHDMVNQNVSEMNPSENPKKSPNFDDIKSFYFKGLSQECKDCNV